jgi:hypothetical protein
MGRKDRKRVYTKIELNELSNVDRPAQEHAKALIIKRVEKAETKTEDGKRFPASDFAYTPDKSKPSTWKLRLTSTPGGSPDPRIVGAAAAALGPGFRGNKVQIPSSDLSAVKSKVRGAWKKANPGKTSDDMPSGIKKGENMDEITKAEHEAVIKKVDDLTLELEKSRVLSGMNDKQKEFLSKLADADKEVFLKKTPKEMDSEIEKFSKSEEILNLDGETIRKSVVGESVFSVLKSQHAKMEAIEKQNAEVLENQEVVKFQKKATERFKCLPGDVQKQGAVLQAIEKMDDDVKATINEMLNAGENVMLTKGIFKTVGFEGDNITEKKDPNKKGGTKELLEKKYLKDEKK